MKRYNIWRPIMLIAIALLVNSMVTNLAMLLGMEQEPASNLGFLSMVLAAVIVYSRMKRPRKK